ncbi:MAG: TfoX/Sxy family protein [Dehalococcoidia bacterium]
MAYDEQLAERIREILGPRPDLGERKMFGGLAFMLGGNMACGLIRDELIVRVGPERYHDALAQPHARVVDLTGRPMRGMVLVARQGIAADGDLEAWIERGATFAASLPPK